MARPKFRIVAKHKNDGYYQNLGAAWPMTTKAGEEVPGKYNLKLGDRNQDGSPIEVYAVFVDGGRKVKVSMEDFFLNIVDDEASKGGRTKQRQTEPADEDF